MILLLFTVHGLQSINEPRSTGDNELSWIEYHQKGHQKVVTIPPLPTCWHTLSSFEGRLDPD